MACHTPGTECVGPMRNIVIVVPCFNEALRLDLDAFRQSLTSSSALSYVFVDDGSTDSTAAMLEAFARDFPERVDLVRIETNSGKGEAVRRGVLHASAKDVDLIGYWDADLAAPLTEIAGLVAAFANPSVSFVMGSRVALLGRRVHRRATRHYIGRFFATLVSLLLDLRVYDTQCGAKVLRATTTTLQLFERPFQCRWCFDVELLARMRGLEERREFNIDRQCVEMPLENWRDIEGSRISLGQIPMIAHELFQLRGILARERERGREHLRSTIDAAVPSTKDNCAT